MKKASIKVIGIGGAGGNAVDRMTECKLQGVELIAINTDAQDLKKIRAHKKLQIGKESTRGLGAGMNPELGRKSALEDKEEITSVIAGADLVFLASGLGGGTGGGAIPVVAEIAKNSGALVIAIVTKPFSFEGAWRTRLAQKALDQLQGKVDTLLSISNDKILKLVSQDTSVISAFWAADEILREAVQAMSDLIAKPGLINLDFADLKAVMQNAGQAIVGIGRATGEKRGEKALETALSSPLLSFSPKGAKGVLFNIAGHNDLSLSEIETVAQKIRQEVSQNAKIIFGASYDRDLKEGELRLTFIATGFGA
ncbi:MAG: cell division protein FtsZ [Candidatus Wildermuthbacteria bacterium RIFCSPLOWO2_01_FULL_47_18]|uniref:Cell division protein FtsZ n=2 Tax=Candidatus Wildermuthiibacteriota TaxID=1817923 RepID=A0A1G2RK71_9BACT|nr:MAG: cell division protein FtsZ [Candidatus Wildermuthbacteria bacterium RIFCSPHIGHO2_02_FULL_48_16]OHA73244.1 MAG: cell division protein FtsZ [Candidatus Wildermuthbacteria bacterium RIFCSPLOWO2_01_FULL_47_18]